MCYLVALQNLGITKNNTEEITEFETESSPTDTFHSNCGIYYGNTRYDQKTNITIDLQKLYVREKGEGGA